MAQIKVKNIYYMLSYVYRPLYEAGFCHVAGEEFEHIHDLFAAIMAQGMKTLLKRGIYRDYIPKIESLDTLQGQVCLSETIKQQTQTRRKFICSFDIFTENILHNQILKCTMNLLLKKGSIKQDHKAALKKLLLYFSNVKEISPASIRWNMLHYHQNNTSYKMLLSVCQLIIHGLLLTTESGNYYLAQWLNHDQMHRLYEKFVLAYYQKEHPSYCAKAAHIDWALTHTADRTHLPIMKTDILMTYGNKTLIIDTKWLSKTMQTHSLYQHTTFISSNLYQIFAYVKNKDRHATGYVAGILLYAKTDESITPDDSYIINGNPISLKTLDLGRDWKSIREQLDQLCEWLNE